MLHPQLHSRAYTPLCDFVYTCGIKVVYVNTAHRPCQLPDRSRNLFFFLPYCFFSYFSTIFSLLLFVHVFLVFVLPAIHLIIGYFIFSIRQHMLYFFFFQVFSFNSTIYSSRFSIHLPNRCFLYTDICKNILNDRFSTVELSIPHHGYNFSCFFI